MKYRRYYRNPLKFYYYRVVALFYRILEFVNPPTIENYKQIPIIINNYNRVGSLKELIAGLEKRGYFNIYIIDNKSTYPPLLEYYKTCPHKVFHLEKNMGMTSFWVTDIYKEFKNEFFVYTDSDIVLLDECPDDFMLVFLNTLRKYRYATKVGFSLKIDDLPEYYHLKEEVLDHEKQFFIHHQDEKLFWAPIDTTFALYRPRGKRRHAFFNIEMYRTDFPYMARHIPWYIDINNLDEENMYYLESTKTPTYWTEKSKNAVI